MFCWDGERVGPLAPTARLLDVDQSLILECAMSEFGANVAWGMPKNMLVVLGI